MGPQLAVKTGPGVDQGVIIPCKTVNFVQNSEFSVFNISKTRSHTGLLEMLENTEISSFRGVKTAFNPHGSVKTVVFSGFNTFPCFTDRKPALITGPVTPSDTLRHPLRH